MLLERSVRKETCSEMADKYDGTHSELDTD